MANGVNANDELFWRQVRQAVEMVEVNPTREITVGVGDSQAEVFTSEKIIVIELTEYIPPKTALIVPAGADGEDPRDKDIDTDA
jgi:hypothetical protein